MKSWIVVFVLMAAPVFAQNPAIDTAADEAIKQANEIKRLNHLVVPPPPPPVLTLTCPSAQTAPAASGPVPVAFPAPVVSGGVAPIQVALSQVSGSLFAVGQTAVTVTATDAAAQKQSCSFTVTVPAIVVTPPPPPPPPSGAVFATSFGCSGQTWSTLSQPIRPPCAGESKVMRYGDWHTSGHPLGDEITPLANNPKGTGQGFRHWRGDGTNNNGGSIKIEFPALTEMWVQWYMRYELGFKWSSLNYTKDLYVNIGSMPIATLGFHGTNTFGVAGVNPGWGNPVPLPNGGGWNLIAPGGASDGQFHCYEAHLRVGTVGLAEAWIDGKQTQSQTVNFGSGAFSLIVIGENQATPANGREMATDYDDVIVSPTRTGCL